MQINNCKFNLDLDLFPAIYLDFLNRLRRNSDPPVAITLKNVMDLSSKAIEIASGVSKLIRSRPIMPGSTTPTPPGVGTMLSKEWAKATIGIRAKGASKFKADIMKYNLLISINQASNPKNITAGSCRKLLRVPSWKLL